MFQSGFATNLNCKYKLRYANKNLWNHCGKHCLHAIFAHPTVRTVLQETLEIKEKWMYGYMDIWVFGYMHKRKWIYGGMDISILTYLFMDLGYFKYSERGELHRVVSHKSV